MIFNVSGGGGTALNFRVVGNPQPSTAKENTIWVDTDRINNYYFSAEQPENMVDYDVWISTGTSSPVEFNALKKNGIQVYPISAKQYIGGAWVDKTAKSWQGGNWVEWFTYFYNRGDQCTDITGGWTAVTNKNGRITFNDNDISFGYSTYSDTHTCAYTKNKIDVTNLKTLSALIDVTSPGVVDVDVCIGLFTTNTGYNATPIAYTGTTQKGKSIELPLNVEAYPGIYYIGFKVVGAKATLYEVKARE